MTTITIDRAVLEQALEALEALDAPPSGVVDHYELDRRKQALRAALAQQEQEPVAFYVYEWVNPSDGYVFRSFRPEEHHMGRNPDRVIPVPPRCEWKSLTEDEIRMAYGNDLKYRDGDYERFARAVEAKLKEKNNG